MEMASRWAFVAGFGVAIDGLPEHERANERYARPYIAAYSRAPLPVGFALGRLIRASPPQGSRWNVFRSDVRRLAAPYIRGIQIFTRTTKGSPFACCIHAI